MSNPDHNQGQGMPSQYAAEYPAYGGPDDTDLQGGPCWAPEDPIAQVKSYHEPEHYPPPRVSDASMGAFNAACEIVVDPNSRGSVTRDQGTCGDSVVRDSYDQDRAAVSSAYVNTYTYGQQNCADGNNSATLSASPSSTLVNFGSCTSSTMPGEKGRHRCRGLGHFGDSHDRNVANNPSIMLDQFLAGPSGSEVQESLQRAEKHFPRATVQDFAFEYAQDLRVPLSESDDGEADDKHQELPHKSKSKHDSSGDKWESGLKEKKKKKKSGKNDKSSRK